MVNRALSANRPGGPAARVAFLVVVMVMLVLLVVVSL